MARRGPRWIRGFSHPLVTLALALFLIFDARQMPNGRNGEWSYVGTLLTADHHYFDAPPGPVVEEVCPIAWVVREAGGLRLAPFSEDRTMADSDAIAYVRVRRDRSGFWSVVEDVTWSTFDLGPWEKGFFKYEVDRVRAMAATFVLDQDDGSHAWQAPLIAGGDTVVRRVNWLGYANNVVVLVAAALCLWSLGWVPGYCRMYLEWRIQMERLKHVKEADRMRNKCLRCGYDTRGLPGPLCPECGEVIRPSMQAV